MCVVFVCRGVISHHHHLELVLFGTFVVAVVHMSGVNCSESKRLQYYIASYRHSWE